jgi:hypothetical protein
VASPSRPQVHKGKARAASGGGGSGGDVAGTWFDGHRPRAVASPGPGSYDLRAGGVAWGQGQAPLLRRPVGPSSGAAGTCVGGSGGAVSWTRVPCAPSIPARGQDLGYEVFVHLSEHVFTCTCFATRLLSAAAFLLRLVLRGDTVGWV